MDDELRYVKAIHFSQCLQGFREGGSKEKLIISEKLSILKMVVANPERLGYCIGVMRDGNETTKEDERMKKKAYKITVGEVGNEIGHTTTSHHVSDEAAITKARRECAPYHGDGWWIVEDDSGQHIASGGRKSM